MYCNTFLPTSLSLNLTHSPAATKDTHQASTDLNSLAWFSQHYESVSFSAESVNVINRIVTFHSEFRVFTVIYFGGLWFIADFLSSTSWSLQLTIIQSEECLQ